MFGSPVKLDRHPHAQPRGSAPDIGEHTADVLRALGHSTRTRSTALRAARCRSDGRHRVSTATGRSPSITIDRPEKLNALTLAMYEELGGRLRRGARRRPDRRRGADRRRRPGVLRRRRPRRVDPRPRRGPLRHLRVGRRAPEAHAGSTSRWSPRSTGSAWAAGSRSCCPPTSGSPPTDAAVRPARDRRRRRPGRRHPRPADAPDPATPGRWT